MAAMASVFDELPLPLPLPLLEEPELPEPFDPNGEFPDDPPKKDPNGESPDEPDEPNGDWPVELFAFDDPEPEFAGAVLLPAEALVATV